MRVHLVTAQDKQRILSKATLKDDTIQKVTWLCTRVRGEGLLAFDEYRRNVRQPVYVPRTLAGMREKRCVHSSLPRFSLVLLKSCMLQTCQQGSVSIYTDG